jgi:hypothetical protein
MKLPNAHLAVVEQEKLIGYLLNAAHPDNGGNASFFRMLGFYESDWPAFAKARHRLADAGELVKSLESAHGKKYIVDGWITAPSGRSAMVRSVWIVDRGLVAPRLITAYPA